MWVCALGIESLCECVPWAVTVCVSVCLGHWESMWVCALGSESLYECVPWALRVYMSVCLGHWESVWVCALGSESLCECVPWTLRVYVSVCLGQPCIFRKYIEIGTWHFGTHLEYQAMPTVSGCTAICEVPPSTLLTGLQNNRWASNSTEQPIIRIL